MLAAGAVGTLVGGVLVDRWGARGVLVGTQVLLLPLLVALPLAGAARRHRPARAAIGFVTIASFSITIVLGQAYLPSRVGLASGVTLGLAIGLGGVAATALGVVADAAGLRRRAVDDRGAAGAGAPARAQPALRCRRRAVARDCEAQAVTNGGGR